MAGEFHREYLVRLPLPLAQLYSRAHNAKDARGRHDNTFYLFEALVKLTTTPLAACYVDEIAKGGQRVESLDRLLSQLVLPSLGQWVGMLRELARYFGNRPDASSHPLGHLWEQLDRPHRDLKSLVALYRRIKNGPDGAAAGDQSCSLLQVFDSLVQYRNGVFGHGAGRFESFYEKEMGPLLFPATNELFSEGVLDLLGPRGSRLVYLTEVSAADESHMEVGMRELIGLQSERMSPLSVPRREAGGLSPNRVAVVWPGRAVPLRLDPMLWYRETELAEELLFLNRDRQGKHVEYLSYTTGRTDRDRSSSASLATLMSHLTGREVSEEQLEALAAATTEEGAAAETTAAAPAARRLGDYEILAEVGRGGMGVVYLARQMSLGRLVALKMLPADLAGDEIALARFRREIRHLARCEHPNIVKVLSSGTMPDGQLYYTMEYVPGSDLELVWRELSGSHRHGDASSLGSTSFARAILSATRKRRQSATRGAGYSSTATGGSPGPISTGAAGLEGIEGLSLPALPELPSQSDDPGGYVRRVAALMRDAALALQTVHEQQIVHRDVKPANLMLTPDGSRVVLMDFGLAKGQTLAPSISRAGGLQGTLRYAAPEQLAAARLKVGPAADVRGLGVSLWELLTRQRLFGEAEDEVQLATMIHDTDVPRLRAVDPSLDRDLEAIVARATERRAADRIQTAGQLAEYLQLYLEGKPLPIRPPTTAEMLGRWVRTHRPLVASASAAALLILIVVVVAFALVTGSRNKAVKLAAENASLAEKEAGARQLAEKALSSEALQRARAEKSLKQAEHDLYLSNILQAHREWIGNNVTRARELLDLCPVEPREWEWYYLDRLYRGGMVIDAHPGGANSVAISPDGKLLASCGEDKQVKLWDASSGKLLHNLEGHTSPVNRVAFSPDGRWLASAGDDNLVFLWDAKTATKKKELNNPTAGATCVAFSPDSKLLAATSRDQKVWVWNVDDDAPPVAVTGYNEVLLAVTFAPSGKFMMFGGRSGYVMIGSPTSTTAGAKMFTGDPFFIYSVAIDPPAKRVAVGNMAVRVINFDDANTPVTIGSGGEKIRGVAFNSDGTQLAGGGDDHAVRIWNPESKSLLSTFQGHTDAVTGVVFTPDDHRLLSSSKDGSVRAWELLEGFAGHKDRVTDVACLPGGKRFATVSQDRTVKLWDAKSGRELHSCVGHTGTVNCVAASPDGKLIASGGSDRQINIWDADSGRLLRTLKGHEGGVLGVAFSPDSTQLASAGDDHTVRIWDVALGRELRSLPGVESGATCVAYTPDGTKVVAGCRNHNALLWNAADGKLLSTFKGHSDTIWRLAISPDGRLLATGGWDKTVRLWDLASARALKVLRGHTATVTALAYAPDGHRIVSADGAQNVKVWEPESGREVVAFPGTRGTMLGMAFGPKAEYLLLGSDSGKVFQWFGSVTP